MYTFVKVNDYDQWYLLARTIDECPNYLAFMPKMEQTQKSLMSENIRKGIFLDLHSYATRLDIVRSTPIDYVGAIIKYSEPLLIQENGAYCFLGDSQIVETVGKNTIYWPHEGDIVICENDSTPEEKWVQYLETTFPGKEICTLNLFCARTVDEIVEQIANKQIITFCTTFGQTDWFETLVKAVVTRVMKNKEFIFFCWEQEKWNDPKIQVAVQMLKLNNKVHIIKHLHDEN